MIKKINLPRLKSAKFHVIPIPFEDEVFSSWIVRTAYAHKTHPSTFTNQYLKYRYNSFFRKNTNISITMSAINEIENKCYNKVDIYNLTLKSYDAFLQKKIKDTPNILLSDLKYCPACLNEDDIPYFRKKWYIIFYNICNKHHCYLHEHCPRCNSKINITKMYNDKKSYIYCYKCGFSLKKAKIVTICKDHILDLKYQNNLMDILEKGYFKYNNKCIYSFMFFEVFVQLSKIILSKKKHLFINTHPSYPNIQNIKKQNYSIGIPIYKQITILERSSLYSIIFMFFRNDNKNFEKYISLNNLTYPDMLKDMTYIPYWYNEIILSFIDKKL